MAVGTESRVYTGAPFTIGCAVPERLALDRHPDEQTFSSYVLTRAAERALAAIDRACGGAAAVFWITGPAGSGKTHFLDYLLALEQRAAPAAEEPGRPAAFAIEANNPATLETQILHALGDAISADKRTQQTWHGVRGAAAVKIALEHARRIGFRVVTGFVDLGTSQLEAAVVESLLGLAQAARDIKELRFSIVAASREPAPEGAVALEVAPADQDEAMTVAMRRARTVEPRAIQLATKCLDGIEMGGGLDPSDSFPFHPAALKILRSLATPPGSIAAIASLIRDSLAAVGITDRFVYPADLAAVADVMTRARSRLGASGVAALELAERALLSSWGSEREQAEEIVHTLTLMKAAGAEDGISTRTLMAMLPAFAGAAPDRWLVGALAQRLHRLSRITSGVIVYVADSATFDPRAGDAPEVARFNDAIGLLRKFDPALPPAAAGTDIGAHLEHLGIRMAESLENSDRVRRVLDEALSEAGAQLTTDSRLALAEYSALAGKGAAALIEIAGDRERRERAIRAIEQFHGLARAADLVPRIRTMREYLEATGLAGRYGTDGAGDPAIEALETERVLLAAELSPRLLAVPSRNFDAIEARFKTFRANYVQRYLDAHARWREENRRARAMADDLQQRLEALRLLNGITALGLAEGAALSGEAAEICGHISSCNLDGPHELEISPRCACGFTLGMGPPMQEISDLMTRTGRAIEAKLAALSHSAVRRIIAEHDRQHRLDGFLKIIQAAQTDALVKILDGRLADYLSQLLDENLDALAARSRWDIRTATQEPARRRRHNLP